MLLTVIAFDVATDHRRRKLTRVLQACGERVLESIFEAWLTDAQRRQLERRALQCIDPSSDRLAFYTLPPADAQDRVVIGKGEATQDRAYTVF